LKPFLSLFQGNSRVISRIINLTTKRVKGADISSLFCRERQEGECKIGAAFFGDLVG